MKATAFFWFRRDLRIYDNHGLFKALSENNGVIPVFIFDKNILEDLKNPFDARVNFIYDQLSRLKSQLRGWGSDLLIAHDTPENAWKHWLAQFPGASVYTNQDYEPYARKRDENIGKIASEFGVNFYTFKDQLIFEPGEILKDDGQPYTVFTPFSKKWKFTLQGKIPEAFPSENYIHNFFSFKGTELPTLESIGFGKTVYIVSGTNPDPELLKQYSALRDLPGKNATSRISVHLRFGTVSIRQLFKLGMQYSEKWTDELIWREFYQHILFHFPDVVTRSFKPAYDNIPWRNNMQEFTAWCEGKIGYPIVDAGMRELNQTGFMHNRVRMIVSSFLTKHLLIDWRWGEAYFAEKLMDYELASNNGGWQWAAGCGVDAAPYFRIFNPTLQTQKFDPQLTYIKKWVPEFGSLQYPAPVVNHEFARKRCLEVYKSALGNI